MNIGEFVPALRDQAGVYFSQVANVDSAGDNIYPWRTPFNEGNGINKGNALCRFSVRSSCKVTSTPDFAMENLPRYTLVTDGQKQEVETPQEMIGPYWKIDGATYAILVERASNGFRISRMGIWKGADLSHVLKIAVELSSLNQD